MDAYSFFTRAQGSFFANDIDGAILSLETGLRLYKIKIPLETDKSLEGKHERFVELNELLGKLFHYENEQDVRDWTASKWVK